MKFKLYIFSFTFDIVTLSGFMQSVVIGFLKAELFKHYSNISNHQHNLFYQLSFYLSVNFNCPESNDNFELHKTLVKDQNSCINSNQDKIVGVDVSTISIQEDLLFNYNYLSKK